KAKKSLLRDDANNVIQWLQQIGDDGCRYARLLDGDHLTAVLWSTKEQREPAKLYGQVVIQDSTFGTNCFGLPFFVDVCVDDDGRLVLSLCAVFEI
ncbi:unnamed protein product, partial [Phaeothamnion confervicola]